ncbi:hypothetical protein BDP81DRAFT_440841 [Colletotrichum phormii]|uniref:Uncharacterized protein n=1 Tax=Colletotrichum phormii TaxID=359342 RepID=A0AAJ0E9H1_9PEZI|nr:uncharacterized protein BDP81DRAFT_440841 [Colletotrichum phormii]KAK1622785.1 hypothetical protein BDP81DRAFT_440841 [Colletotrichum phormii]
MDDPGGKMSLKTGVGGSETVSGAEQSNDIGPNVSNILVLKCTKHHGRSRDGNSKGYLSKQQQQAV